MKILSWNVNGIRACVRKGIRMARHLRGRCRRIAGGPRLPEQLTEEVLAPAGWHTHFFSAVRKGYSGVALYSRHPYHFRTYRTGSGGV